MNRACSKCQLVFEKEPGYFLGSSLIAYTIEAIALIPTLIWGLYVRGMNTTQILAISILQMIVMHPIVYRISKLAWLWIETRMTESFNKE